MIEITINKGAHMKQFRQGDVFIEQVEETSNTGESIPLDNNRIVLEYGEVTGHAHAIYEPSSAVLMRRKGDGIRHLRVIHPVSLLHEEHAPIQLPPGLFKITRQREYSPEEIRYVAD